MTFEIKETVKRKVIDPRTMTWATKLVRSFLMEVATQAMRENLAQGVIGVHGGFSKTVMRDAFGIPQPPAYIDSMDVDMVVLYSGELEEALSPTGGNLENALEQIQTSFGLTRVSKNVCFEQMPTEEGEAARAGLDRAISEVIRKSDFNINGNLLLLEEGQLVLYYSDSCLRGLRSGKLVFGINSPTIARLHHERYVPLPLMAERATRYCAKGEVGWVYFPQKDIDLLWRESEGREPLGTYGLLLCAWCEDPALRGPEREILKTRAMRFLTVSGLTETETFAEFKSTLEREFRERNNGADFQLNEHRSLQDIIKAQLEREAERKRKKENRKQYRDHSDHGNIKSQILTGRNAGYTMKRCDECGWMRFYDPQGKRLDLSQLPYNQDLLYFRTNQMPQSSFLDVEGMMEVLSV